MAEVQQIVNSSVLTSPTLDIQKVPKNLIFNAGCQKEQRLITTKTVVIETRVV